MPQDETSEVPGAERIRPILWPALVPCIILLLVAGVQIYLALASNLTPWKGGGFGMFSTTDHSPHRYVRIFVEALEMTNEVEPAQELTKLVERVKSFPGEPLLTILARQIQKQHRDAGIPVESVRIEVWRVEYRKGDLAAKSKNLRKFTYIPD